MHIFITVALIWAAAALVTIAYVMGADRRMR